MNDRKFRHIIISTHGIPIEGLPFQGEMMICYICGAKKKSDPNEESNWNCFQYINLRIYLCPDCWNDENLEKVLHDLVKKARKRKYAG